MTAEAGKQFLEAISKRLSQGEKTTAAHVNKLAEKIGITQLEARNLTETALIRQYKKQKSLAQVIEAYKTQPNISQRTATSIFFQQYSTPAPIAYMGGKYVGPGKVLDPTAGTGMFSIALPRDDDFYANELEENRIEALKLAGFKNVTPYNALQICEKFRKKSFDGLLINPPFGSKTYEFEGEKLKKLEQKIVLETLALLKDQGRAFIIIGNNTTFKTNEKFGYKIMDPGDFSFFKILQKQYVVEDVINVSGDLYAKQGTTFPIRIILINGRKATPDEKAPLYRFNEAAEKDFHGIYARILQAEMRRNDPSGLASPYIPTSDGQSLDVEIPDNMYYGTLNALRVLEETTGKTVDRYVCENLKWTKAQLHSFLSAEQIDAVALSVYNGSMIVADQTGVGKGRIAAAMIRYAVLSGHIPVFFTEKPTLFSDLYRDLKAIGCEHYRPFIINSKEEKTKIKDQDGKVIYEPFAAGELPKEMATLGTRNFNYEVILCTYSQISGNNEDDPKKAFLKKAIYTNGHLILDESHNASGQSNTGEFFIKLLKAAPSRRNVLFLSATYAKRPDNMALYSLVTNVQYAGLSDDKLIEVVKKGGVALQEVISAELSKEGQLIRRERSYAKATVNYHLINDNEIEKSFDRVTTLLRAMAIYQETFINKALKAINQTLLQEGETQSYVQTGKTEKLGAANTPVFSRLFLLINQLLFNLKVDYVVTLCEQRLQEGFSVIISISNTMESFMDRARNGQIENNFKIVLKEAFDSLFRYKIAEGSAVTDRIFTLEDLDRILPLDSTHRKDYEHILKGINELTGVSLSPIDTIKKRLEYLKIRKDRLCRVAEITGRKSQLSLNGDLSAGEIKSRTPIPPRDVYREFNDNEIDVILLNQAGATGASAQAMATKKVPRDNVRKRCMIVLQAELDVNTEVQKRGRVYRTGQIYAPTYDYVSTRVPAEQRMLMMLKHKLSSLDANTSSNQKQSDSLFAHGDFLNKYGDQVVSEWLSENTAIANTLDLEAGDREKKKNGADIYDLAKKASGRVALLSISDQNKFYNEVLQAYQNVVNHLKEVGQFDLELETIDLKAETIEKKTLYAGNFPMSSFGQTTFLETCIVNNLKKPLLRKELEKEIAKAKDTEKQQGDLKEKVSAVLSKAHADLKETDARLTKTQERYYAKIKRIFYDRTIKVGDVFSSGEGDYKTVFVFLGYSMKSKTENPFTLSTVTARFAVNRSTRMVNFTLSNEDMYEAYTDILNKTKTSIDYEIDLWEKNCMLSSKDRVTRRIITGNILQAYKKDNLVGIICSYTTKDGEIKNGILLPQDEQTERRHGTIVKTGAATANPRISLENFENVLRDIAEPFFEKGWGENITRTIRLAGFGANYEGNLFYENIHGNRGLLFRFSLNKKIYKKIYTKDVFHWHKTILNDGGIEFNEPRLTNGTYFISVRFDSFSPITSALRNSFYAFMTGFAKRLFDELNNEVTGDERYFKDNRVPVKNTGDYPYEINKKTIDKIVEEKKSLNREKANPAPENPMPHPRRPAVNKNNQDAIIKAAKLFLLMLSN